MKHVRRIPHLSELTTKAKVGLGFIIFVIVGAATTLIITSLVSRQLSLDDTTNQNFVNKDTQTRQKDARTSAYDAVKGGNDKKAGDIYQKAIAAEPDPAAKVKLAINYSRLLATSGNFEQAESVAKAAQSYSTDKYYISDWLGRLYEGNKRYSDAITSYTLAGTLVNSPTNDKGYDKKYYDTKVSTIKQLENKN